MQPIQFLALRAGSGGWARKFKKKNSVSFFSVALHIDVQQQQQQQMQQQVLIWCFFKLAMGR